MSEEFEQGELIDVSNDFNFREPYVYPAIYLCKLKQFFVCCDTTGDVVQKWCYARKIAKKPLAGHNPDGVNELPQGCIRLLDDDEVGERFTELIYELYRFCSNQNRWSKTQRGCYLLATYATSLTREELAEKRGLTHVKRDPNPSMRYEYKSGKSNLSVPVQQEQNDQQKEMVRIMSSMAVSKREQFAMAAMQSLFRDPDLRYDYTCVAMHSFRMADAMLAESKKEVQS